MLLPLDSRPIPDFDPTLAAQIQIARSFRASPAMCAAESLLGYEDYGKSVFDDHVLRRYVTDRFGAPALEKYQAALPSVSGLLPMIDEGGWRASPLSTALSLGSDIVPGENFLYAPHHRVISNLVVRSIMGVGKRRIAVALPFRHGKSSMASIACPLWFLANFPHLNVGVCSHSESLSMGFTRIVRNVIAGRQDKFGFSLAADSQSVHDFHTSLGGRVWQGSVGSGIVGKGAELLVLDDLLRGTQEGTSPTALDAAWAWLCADALTRLQNQGVALFVTTRYSEKDPFGRLQSGYDGVDPDQWEFVSLPAIAEEDDPITGRAAGEALWPAKRPLSELLSFKAGMSEEAWQLGFQQTTIENTGIGRCYPNFDPTIHVGETWFDPSLPIRVSFDFNVDGFACILAQAHEVVIDRKLWLLTNQRFLELSVLREIVLNNTTTETACETIGEVLRQYAKQCPRRLKIQITGDASGSQRRTSASPEAKNDWDQVRAYFNRRRDVFDTSYDIRSSNPGQKQRIDKLNSLIRNAGGMTLFKVAPSCKALIEDLKTVRWAKDASGNTLFNQSKKDPERTHTSDALGYMCMSVAGGPQAYEMRESIR
jgi:hypothetical protein